MQMAPTVVYREGIHSAWGALRPDPARPANAAATGARRPRRPRTQRRPTGRMSQVADEVWQERRNSANDRCKWRRLSSTEKGSIPPRTPPAKPGAPSQTPPPRARRPRRAVNPARRRPTGRMSQVGDEVWQERRNSANDRCKWRRLSSTEKGSIPPAEPSGPDPARASRTPPPRARRRRRAANRPGAGRHRPEPLLYRPFAAAIRPESTAAARAVWSRSFRSA
jgi:hypothetical protein